MDNETGSYQATNRIQIMLDQCTKEERWSGVNTMIDRWLKDRQTLIVQFCAVSGVHCARLVEG